MRPQQILTGERELNVAVLIVDAVKGASSAINQFLKVGGEIVKAAWNINGIFKADAEKVSDELSAIKCTPSNVVEHARNPKTELHKCFEWNDSITLRKDFFQFHLKCIHGLLDTSTFLFDQVIRNLVIIKEETEEKTPIRLFYNTGDRTGEYKPVQLVMRKEDEYKSLLNKAQEELRMFKKKYQCLTELEEILSLISY